MKQPEIGKVVTDLRLRKGMTQEKLAELCEVSTRTIQRIESGEVDPRSFTLKNLSTILEFDFLVEEEQNDTFWITLLHLSSMFSIVIIPLLIWSFRKKNSVDVDEHGRQALNFQITITIVLIGSVLLYIVALPAFIILMERFGRGSEGLFAALSLVGLIPLIGIGILCFIQGLKNALRGAQGQRSRYFPTIPFLK